jgi:hypothetical protein
MTLAAGAAGTFTAAVVALLVACGLLRDCL